MNDMGPLPRVHPRVMPVERARGELAELLLAWRDRHALTLSEELALIADHLHGALSRCVRSERREAEAEGEREGEADG
jgi:hypothetical protein